MPRGDAEQLYVIGKSTHVIRIPLLRNKGSSMVLHSTGGFGCSYSKARWLVNRY